MKENRSRATSNLKPVPALTPIGYHAADAKRNWPRFPDCVSWLLRSLTRYEDCLEEISPDLFEQLRLFALDPRIWL
jgi:hypothetical protein